jgi:hypothetical protein
MPCREEWQTSLSWETSWALRLQANHRGRSGLMGTVEKFDYSNGIKSSTCAIWAINCRLDPRYTVRLAHPDWDALDLHPETDPANSESTTIEEHHTR